MKQYMENTSIPARIAEIEWKVARLRERMTEKGLDAILINKSENFAWITAGGDNIVTRYTENGICTIMITKDARYFICNNVETLRMIEEELLPDLGFEALTMMWFENKTQELIRGVIGGGKYASDNGIPDSVNANEVILVLERVLCENEIGRYLQLGKIYSPVIESYMTTIKPGDTEVAIAGRLGVKMWENGLEPVLYLVASDERILKYRHPVPTNKRVENVLMISCNARYKGLITKITRMMYFGKAPAELLEQYQKNIVIENRMVAMTRPGVSDKDIFDSAKRFYAEAGYPEMWQMHHQGGPESYTNGFYLMSDDVHEVVRLHQCYGYNPSITGTKTEDGFIVDEEGPIFLTYPVIFPKLASEIDGIHYVRPGMLEV
jgi:Xaa-Pro dipeptidase